MRRLLTMILMAILVTLSPLAGDAQDSRVALDATRFRQKTGWSPRIGLEESLRDTLDFWRAAIHELAGAGGRRPPTIA